MKKQKKAVGYVRGLKRYNQWTDDCRIQVDLIRERAVEEGLELVETFFGDQKLDPNKGKINPEIVKTILYARGIGAVLLFVDIGRYRRNPFFTAAIRELNSQKTQKNRSFIKIPPTRELVESIERQARIARLDALKREKRGKGKPKKKPASSTIEEWQNNNGVGTKRMNNFKHLYNGVTPIYRLIGEHREKPPAAIARILNNEFHLTVSGKRWDRDNTRKAMDLVETELFRSYVAMREELKPEPQKIKCRSSDPI